MASTLLVFSHLRWDFVFQRPQHLLSRLARTQRVIFVEEPLHEPGCRPRLERYEIGSNVTILRPISDLPEPGFSDAQLERLRSLIARFLQEERVCDYAAWFYTPMALPVLDDLQPQAVIFDVMDELSLFKFAPPQLLEREARLLEIADVVFTGGPSLYKAKKGRARSVYCFPSSVDRAHFAQATEGCPEAPDQRGIARPRLGFFGVIDERLDVELLDRLAAERPDWQFAMVGPVVKIDPAHLPRRANIHWLGQRQYKDLPGLLAGWDVCLLPFALNDSTRFISPTKTLEYMAAGKPIVSSAITDVVEPYGHCVAIARTPEQWLAACEAALRMSEEDLRLRRAQYDAVLNRTSWDRTAAEMQRLIAAARAGEPAAAPRAAADAKVIVIGAGPTGLSAAYHLGDQALLVERNPSVGGWCRSLQQDGFTFDYAGHIMFSNDPYVHEMYAMLLGDNVHWQDREAWIYSKGVYTRYPFQGALYGLPPDVIKECIVGAIEARYGAARPAAPRPAPRGGDVKDCCADGILEAEAPLADAEGAPPANFEEFIYKVWGRGIAEHFAIPYNRKIWAVDLKEMETSWLGGRVPMPDIEDLIEGSLQPAAKPMGPNARFGYPLRGGFQALMDGFLPHLRGRLLLSTGVAAISPSRRTITLTDGTERSYEQIVSTMPLPLLIQAMGEEAPRGVRRAAAALRSTSVRCVNIGVARENITDKHWIYYPEDTIFHRIFVQGNASPLCNPPGGFGFTCEITYSPYKPLPCDGHDLIRRCIDDAIRVGFIRADDRILHTSMVDMPGAYVIYDHERPKNIQRIRSWLLRQGVVLAGRYSEWEYYNSDHAFVAGREAAEAVRQLQRAPRIAPAAEGAELVPAK